MSCQEVRGGGEDKFQNDTLGTFTARAILAFVKVAEALTDPNPGCERINNTESIVYIFPKFQKCLEN